MKLLIAHAIFALSALVQAKPITSDANGISVILLHNTSLMIATVFWSQFAAAAPFRSNKRQSSLVARLSWRSSHAPEDTPGKSLKLQLRARRLLSASPLRLLRVKLVLSNFVIPTRRRSARARSTVSNLIYPCWKIIYYLLYRQPTFLRSCRH